MVREAGGELLLIQVSESLAEQATRRRELRALEAAMRETGHRQGMVVTLGR